jgi:hypothetical protein
MIAVNLVETMAGIGVAVGAAVGVIALGEKITGLLGRWVRRQVVEATAPIEGVTRHHLGPNGDTIPLHHRFASTEQKVAAIEQKIEKIERCPHLRGEEVA